MKALHEADILSAIAKAQGILTTTTAQLLKRDKYDGLRAAEWLKKHSEVFRTIRDECRSYGLVTDEELSQADKLAKEPQ